MDKLHASEDLVDHILLVYVQQDLASNNCVKVRLHELEYEVQIVGVVGRNQVEQTHHVLVSSQLL